LDRIGNKTKQVGNKPRPTWGCHNPKKLNSYHNVKHPMHRSTNKLFKIILKGICRRLLRKRFFNFMVIRQHGDFGFRPCCLTMAGLWEMNLILLSLSTLAFYLSVRHDHIDAEWMQLDRTHYYVQDIYMWRIASHFKTASKGCDKLSKRASRSDDYNNLITRTIYTKGANRFYTALHASGITRIFEPFVGKTRSNKANKNWTQHMTSQLGEQVQT
jgi:hypothetical protein